METPMARLAWSICLLSLAIAPVAPALAKSPPPAVVSGVIKSFECGDNCYLIITTDKGEEVTGLCVAKACRPWNDKVAIPKRLIGAKVQVTIGEGRQLDDSGNDMGPFPAFTSVVVKPR
jgi:hypothetical protein